VLGGVYIAGLWAVLAFGIPSGAPLHKVWKARLERGIDSQAAQSAGFPRPPLALTDAIDALRAGRPEETRAVLSEVDPEEYPNLRFDHIRAWLDSER